MNESSRNSAVTAARITYGFIAAVVLSALVIQLVLIFTGGADANSGESGTALSIPTRLWRFFSFFTVESNIVVMIVCLFLVANPRRTGRWWNVARLNALLAIIITGLVFAIVLAPQLHLEGWALVATILLHYISPWTSLAAWLIFGPRPRFRWATVAGAFILPIGWLIYIFTQGAFTRWYPYPFLDVTQIGLGRAVINALLVIVVAAVIAVALKLVDARLRSVVTDSSQGR